MAKPKQEEKVPFKIWLSKRTAARLRVAYSDEGTGELKFGVLTKLAEVAIDRFLKAVAGTVNGKDREMELVEGTPEWMAEQRRLAAADLLEPEQLAKLIDRLREGRKTMSDGKRSGGKKSTKVTTLDLGELEAIL